jgi:hypothetical protein
MNIESYDDLYETFYQLVLPQYTLEEIPSGAVDNVFSHLVDLLDEGDMHSSEDMINSIDEWIRLGWTRSVFLTK